MINMASAEYTRATLRSSVSTIIGRAGPVRGLDISMVEGAEPTSRSEYNFGPAAAASAVRPSFGPLGTRRTNIST